MTYEDHKCLRSHRVWTSPESCSIWLSPDFDFKQVIRICRARFVDRENFLREQTIWPYD